MKSFLQFLDHYNPQIIQWLMFVISALFVWYIWIIIKNRGKDEGSGAGVDSAQFNKLEQTLKKVIEQTKGGVGSGAQSSTSSNSGGAADPDELNALSQKISEQQEEIAVLKTKLEEGGADAAADAGAGGSDTDVKGYLEKIQDLEARLQEYEIIEDDIADLSLYKEENSKLKKELEQIKTGGATVTPTPEPLAAETDVVQEFSESVAAEPAVDEPAAEPPEAASVAEAQVEDPPTESPAPVELESSRTPADAEEEFITDDVLAEFSAAVDEEFGAVAERPKSKPAEDLSDEEIDNLLDQAVAEEAGKPAVAGATSPGVASKDEGSALTEDGQIDTSKMMDEMDQLTQAAASDNGDSALEQDADIDKMAEEASKLGS